MIENILFGVGTLLVVVSWLMSIFLAYIDIDTISIEEEKESLQKKWKIFLVGGGTGFLLILIACVWSLIVECY